MSFYTDLDALVARYGVTPSRPERIADFPYLRMTRFLAAFSNQRLDGGALQSWLNHLAAADKQARAIELASLESRFQSKIAAKYSADPVVMLEACPELLIAHDLEDPERLKLLRKRAVASDEYRLLNRMFGLYPLTQFFVKAAVHRYQNKIATLFSQPLEKLPVHGKLQRFYMPQTGHAHESVTMVRDALGVPIPTTSQLNHLYARHAPVWEIDVAGRYDFPGKPFWNIDGKPDVDHVEAAIYRFPSYMFWQGDVLLQLNYLIWFAERPDTGIFDIFSGRLDGLLWRVTLDTDGAVLIYDSIHACGCYHFFFPTDSLKLRPEAGRLPEPPLLPQLAPRLTSEEKIVIRVASGTHYIQKLYADTSSGQRMHWQEYQTLYAIPAAGNGRTSLFQTDGLVAGSERMERWLLWPMGVPSAGAMRERGRHATAFVGARHFDDARLLDNLFEPASALIH
ncbi:MAG: hypothetical protein NMNS02_03850 [Nitrosomonas sp.]|nr:MAG: hypothetical protein NMNS02_03850 [Nitrosomonas sp.]